MSGLGIHNRNHYILFGVKEAYCSITIKMEVLSKEDVEQEQLGKHIDDEEDLREHVEDDQVVALPATTAETAST